MKRLCQIAACSVILLGGRAVLAQQFDQPGPEHKLLATGVGTWDAMIKTDGSPDSKGTMVVKSVNGGMWFAAEFKGDFGGTKFEGHGLDGYDQKKKKYVSVWTDSMSSGFMTLEGTHDEKSKTTVMFGEGAGPDGMPTKYKSVTKFTDDDHQVFDMFMIAPGGAEVKMMSIEYARKK